MRPRGPIFLLALAILATFVAYTCTSRPLTAALPRRPERHVLDNGVRVIPGREVTHRYVRAVEAVADIQRVAQAYPVGGTTVGLRAAG